MKGRNAKGGGKEPPPFAFSDSCESRLVVVEREFVVDLGYWIEVDARVALRIVTLMLDVMRNPLDGIGKPKPLKHDLRGYWSRRITDEHRLLYRVVAERVELVSARHHYA